MQRNDSTPLRQSSLNKSSLINNSNAYYDQMYSKMRGINEVTSQQDFDRITKSTIYKPRKKKLYQGTYQGDSQNRDTVNESDKGMLTGYTMQDVYTPQNYFSDQNMTFSKLTKSSVFVGGSGPGKYDRMKNVILKPRTSDVKLPRISSVPVLPEMTEMQKKQDAQILFKYAYKHKKIKEYTVNPVIAAAEKEKKEIEEFEKKQEEMQQQKKQQKQRLRRKLIERKKQEQQIILMKYKDQQQGITRDQSYYNSQFQSQAGFHPNQLESEIQKELQSDPKGQLQITYLFIENIPEKFQGYSIATDIKLVDHQQIIKDNKGNQVDIEAEEVFEIEDNLTSGLAYSNIIDINPYIYRKNQQKSGDNLGFLLSLGLEPPEDQEEDENEENEISLGWHYLKIFDDKGNLKKGILQEKVFANPMPQKFPYSQGKPTVISIQVELKYLPSISEQEVRERKEKEFKEKQEEIKRKKEEERKRREEEKQKQLQQQQNKGNNNNSSKLQVDKEKINKLAKEKYQSDPNGKLKITYEKITEIEKKLRTFTVALDYFILDNQGLLQDRKGNKIKVEGESVYEIDAKSKSCLLNFSNTHEVNPYDLLKQNEAAANDIVILVQLQTEDPEISDEDHEDPDMGWHGFKMFENGKLKLGSFTEWIYVSELPTKLPIDLKSQKKHLDTLINFKIEYLTDQSEAQIRQQLEKEEIQKLKEQEKMDQQNQKEKQKRDQEDKQRKQKQNQVLLDLEKKRKDELKQIDKNIKDEMQNDPEGAIEYQIIDIKGVDEDDHDCTIGCDITVINNSGPVKDKKGQVINIEGEEAYDINDKGVCSINQNTVLQFNPYLLRKQNKADGESIHIFTNFQLEVPEDEDDDEENPLLGFHSIKLFDDKGNLKQGQFTEQLFEDEAPEKLPFNSNQAKKIGQKVTYKLKYLPKSSEKDIKTQKEKEINDKYDAEKTKIVAEQAEQNKIFEKEREEREKKEKAEREEREKKKKAEREEREKKQKEEKLKKEKAEKEKKEKEEKLKKEKAEKDKKAKQEKAEKDKKAKQEKAEKDKKEKEEKLKKEKEEKDKKSTNNSQIDKEVKEEIQKDPNGQIQIKYIKITGIEDDCEDLQLGCDINVIGKSGILKDKKGKPIQIEGDEAYDIKKSVCNVNQTNLLDFNPNLVKSQNPNGINIIAAFQLEDPNDDDDEEMEPLGWHGLNIFDKNNQIKEGTFTEDVFEGEAPTAQPVNLEKAKKVNGCKITYEIKFITKLKEADIKQKKEKEQGAKNTKNDQGLATQKREEDRKAKDDNKQKAIDPKGGIVITYKFIKDIDAKYNDYGLATDVQLLSSKGIVMDRFKKPIQIESDDVYDIENNNCGINYKTEIALNPYQIVKDNPNDFNSFFIIINLTLEPPEDEDDDDDSEPIELGWHAVKILENKDKMKEGVFTEPIFQSPAITKMPIDLNKQTKIKSQINYEIKYAQLSK